MTASDWYWAAAIFAADLAAIVLIIASEGRGHRCTPTCPRHWGNREGNDQ